MIKNAKFSYELTVSLATDDLQQPESPKTIVLANDCKKQAQELREIVFIVSGSSASHSNWHRHEIES